MVKSELIQRIASKQRTLSPKDVELGVNQLLEHMSAQLAQNNRIEIRGVGSFSLHHRPARNAHNPKTGAKVYTLETRMPHFKTGKELKARVNRPDKPPLVTDHDDEADEE